MTIKLKERHVDDYLNYRKNIKEICNELNISRSKFSNDLQKLGYKSREKYFRELDFENDELIEKLKTKYHLIIKKIREKPDYANFKFLRLDEYIDFCNGKKGKILKLWNNYIKNDKAIKLTISIDRTDTSEGYISSNMKFVSYGYNAWRRNIRPVKVIYESKKYYFMSCEEGTRYFDIRRQSFGDMLRGKYREISEDYTIKESDIETVLNNSKVDNLEDYYNKYIFRS